MPDSLTEMSQMQKRVERLKLAVQEIRGEFAQIIGRIKEVENDLILVVDSANQLENDGKQPEKS